MYIKGNHHINSDAELKILIKSREYDSESIKGDVTKHIAILLSKYLCSYHDWSKSLHIRDQGDYVRLFLRITNEGSYS